MDFESAMQTFAEAWMAANRSGLPVLGSDNSNSNNKNKTLPMNLVENSTRSADHEEKVRKKNIIILEIGTTMSWINQFAHRIQHTLPTAEILSGKNVRAFLVCGFLMKSFKKNILKI